MTRKLEIKPYVRTHLLRILGGAVLFALLSMAVRGRFGFAPPSEGPLAVAAALLPLLGVGLIIWAMWRQMVEEPDEYLRQLNRDAGLAAAAVVVVVCTGSAFLTKIAGAPAFPMMHVLTLFLVSWSIAFVLQLARGCFEAGA